MSTYMVPHWYRNVPPVLAFSSLLFFQDGGSRISIPTLRPQLLETRTDHTALVSLWPALGASQCSKLTTP